MSALDDYIFYAKQLARNGGPYSPWDGSWPPSPGPPFYIDSGNYSYSYINRWGANCSGFTNLPLWWVGLKAVGGTLAWGDLLLASGNWYERYQSGKLYPTGTFLLQQYGEGPGGEGHIAVVVDGPTGRIAQSDSYSGLNMNKTAEQQNYYTPWGYAAFHPNLIPPEAGGNPTKVLGKYDYPGDCADPAPVARWMARIAHDKYGLPPVLPVMTSYVEMTAAWTSPGCVYNIPGYWNATDYDSLGYFQQRPSAGWGTPDEIRDATYALHKFLEVAAGWKGDFDEGNPDELGEWCANVQRPRDNLRYLYTAKGYEPAIKLIGGWDTEYSGADDEPVPPGPGPEPEPGEKQMWEKYGWYEYASDSSWDLKFHAPEGQTSPLGPEKHKARTKPEVVEYYKKDGKYVVVGEGGTEITYSESEFKSKYEEVQ